MSLNSLQGFKVLPLAFSSDSTSCHSIFVKEHSVRQFDEDKPSGRTLFALNIPSYATENNLKTAFSKAGPIKSVFIQNEDPEKESCDGFRKAHIVFQKREGLLRLMKLSIIDPLSTDEAPVKVGLEKWIYDYNSSISSSKKLQKEINTFMAHYDKQQKKKKGGKEGLLDEEGWTVVTKKGRNPGLSRKESLESKLNEKEKKSLKKKQLKDFYTFQIRESKMEHIAALRKSFEEAKNKINLMKKARKFKPY